MVCVCLVLGGLLSVIIVALVLSVYRKQQYWQKRGIHTTSYNFLLGSFTQIVFRTNSLAHIINDIYTSIKENGKKFGGMYQFTQPILMITDLELIRDVTVKYFDSFSDRRSITTEDVDELFSRTLLSLKGDEWREMRHHISPAFTGSKLRNMVELITKTGEEFTKFLIKREDFETPIDMKEAFCRYSTDVISTTAFGSVSNSINDKQSEFYNNGINIMDQSGLRGLTVMGFALSPKLMSFLNIPFIPQKTKDFFMNLIEENIKYRENENKSRPDMIQLLVEARNTKENKDKDETTEKSDEGEKENKSTITNTDIASQAFTFFLGGFESVSTTLSFCALELAINPEIQDRLRAEVDAAISRNNDKLTYDVLQDLKYMDMVVSETLRKYPPVAFIDRVCSKSIDMPEYDLKLKKGTVIAIPFFGLHHDPEYFPEPDRFDPERFNEANKHNIKPFSYIPFGAGPRNCVGMRFALMEVKLCLANILATTDLHVCEKTQVPIKLAASNTQMIPEGGFWLTVRPRDFPSLIDLDATSSPVDIH